jgi:hypothetical protein
MRAFEGLRPRAKTASGGPSRWHWIPETRACDCVWIRGEAGGAVRGTGGGSAEKGIEPRTTIFFGFCWFSSVFVLCVPSPSSHVPSRLRRGERAEDVRISRVEDAHCRHAVELTAGGAEVDVVAREVVDRRLGEHGVVLNLTLAEGGSVVGDEHELGLARAKRLEGLLVAEAVLACVVVGTGRGRESTGRRGDDDAEGGKGGRAQEFV